MELVPRPPMSDQPQPPNEFGQGAPRQPPAAPAPAWEPGNDPDFEAMERVRPIIEAAEQASVAIIAEAEAQAQRYVEESRQRADEIAAARAREMWSMTDDLIARGEAVRQRSDELLAALAYAKQGLEQALRAEAPAPVQQLHPSGPQPAQPPPAGQPAPPQAQEAPSPGVRGPQPPPPAPPPGPQAAPPTSVPFEPLQQPQAAPAAAPPQPSQAASPSPASQSPQASSPASAPQHPQAGAAPPSGPTPPQTPPPSTAAPQPSEGARLLATQMAVAGSSREEIASRLYNEFGVQEPGPMLDAILGPAA